MTSPPAAGTDRLVGSPSQQTRANPSAGAVAGDRIDTSLISPRRRRVVPLTSCVRSGMCDQETPPFRFNQPGGAVISTLAKYQSRTTPPLTSGAMLAAYATIDLFLR